MLIFQINLDPIAGRRREVLEILSRMIGPTLAQPGCLTCEVYEGVGDNPRILYMEVWSSEAAVRRHVQSANYAKLLAGMELSRTRPEVHFYDVARVDGMDRIESWRTPGAAAR